MEQCGKIYMVQFDRYWRYNHSPKGLARWRKSEQGRGSRADYKRERYHRIQEEAGCYWDIQDFYPAYRLLKALEDAEVVEV